MLWNKVNLKNLSKQNKTSKQFYLLNMLNIPINNLREVFIC